MNQPQTLFDVTEDTFDRYVLENSFHKPVLVDFWAEWCAPCKALLPMLKSMTEEYAGALLLAKVNCDTEPGLTERFGIRSLPTVVLFKDGQPVDGFAGIQPDSAIRAMLAPYVSVPAPDNAAEAEQDISEQVNALLDRGDTTAAIALLQQVLREGPDEHLTLLLVRALGRDRQVLEAQQLLGSIAETEALQPALQRARAQLGFLVQAQGLPARAQLQTRLESTPQDNDALFQLALHALADEEYEAGLGHLLRLFQQQRDYADNTPQRTLLAVFDLLGNAHPLTHCYRRQLYQMLY